MKKISIALLLVFLLILLTSCNSYNELDPEEKITLHVGHEGTRDETFKSHYLRLFNLLYPNVRVEFTQLDKEILANSDNIDSLNTYFENQKFDILILSSEQYEKLAKGNQLVDLSSFIKESKFDIEGFSEPIIEILKNTGNGKLNGLTPYFYSTAIFYNRDLFDQYKIDYPKDYMTWEEILLLANRFPTSQTEYQSFYGLAPMLGGEIFDFIKEISRLERMSFLDSKHTKLQLSTPEWLRISELVVQSYKNRAVHPPIPSGQDKPLDSFDAFLQGQVAMYFGQPGAVLSLQEAKPDFQWGIVSQPVSSTDHKTGTFFALGDIYTISAKSSKAKAAWTLIESIHSDRMARVKSDVIGTPIRAKYTDQLFGIDMTPLYNTQLSKTYPDFPYIPTPFYAEFSQLGNAVFNDVLNNKLTTEEALQKLQSGAQPILEEMQKEQQDDQG